MSVQNGGDLQSPSSSSEAGTPNSPVLNLSLRDPKIYCNMVINLSRAQRFLLPSFSSQTLYKKRKRQASPTRNSKSSNSLKAEPGKESTGSLSGLSQKLTFGGKLTTVSM